MASGTAKPTSLDNLMAGSRGQIARIHTALPGKVVSYDRVSQTAVVRTAVQFKFAHPDTGLPTDYEAPAIARAPVAFPGGGDFSFTWELAAGDDVLLVFAERSLDEWKSRGGAQAVAAGDVRRFDVTDAIVIPALRSPADPIPAAGIDATAMVIRGPEIRLGSASATQFVALANLVLAELNALRAEIILHTHATGIGPTGPAIGVGASSGAVAATKVKAE